MNNNPEKLVAFLDLLGFSEAVKSDLPGAVQLLQDCADAIRIAVDDAAPDADGSVSTNSEALRLMNSMEVTSFEDLLPMSDSIFIVASDASKFVMQLSHLLTECFGFRLNAFADPEHGGDPMAVTTKTVVLAGEQPQIETQPETWWPVLFRGGVAFGKCLALHLPMIADSRSGTCRGLVGSAVVEAVKLEGKTKGPRVLCSAKIKEKVAGNAANYIGPSLCGEEDCVELYWPMASLEDTSNMADAINNHLRQWLKGLWNLYLHFSDNDHVRVHYEMYLRLVVASALQKYPKGKEELTNEILTLDPKLLKIVFPPDIERNVMTHQAEQRSPTPELNAVAAARSKWLEANERASKLADTLFQPVSGYGDPDARLADEHRFRSARDEAERLFREYDDLYRRETEFKMLGLQRSQRLATWASFAVAAVVGLATIIGTVVALLR